MDLQKDGRLESSGVQLINIAVDPVSALAPEVSRFGITTPMLSDQRKQTCVTFGVNCQSMGGKPGHAFVLVGKEGNVKWAKDYGGTMYVEPNEVYSEVLKGLQR